MKANPPTDSRRSPVLTYAIILGTLVLATVVVSTLFGRAHENPKPSAVSSPLAPGEVTPKP